MTSVSKFEETLDEAPATIYVITAKDIENRGYLDIEQIFHDIPGFSITGLTDRLFFTLSKISIDSE